MEYVIEKKDLNTLKIQNKLVSVTAEFFILLIIVLIPILTIFTDLVILKNNVAEISLTEITQEAFLLITLLIYWYGAWRKEEIRGFLVLVAGFFTTLFIRELDVFFDSISHGFWVYIAITTAILSISYSYFFAKGTNLKPFLDFLDTKTYFLLLIGMIILLIFSRAFGSGNLLWSYLLPGEYLFIVKTAIQEGLELLGYAFIFYGSILLKYRNYSFFAYYTSRI